MGIWCYKLPVDLFHCCCRTHLVALLCQIDCTLGLCCLAIPLVCWLRACSVTLVACVLWIILCYSSPVKLNNAHFSVICLIYYIWVIVCVQKLSHHLLQTFRPLHMFKILFRDSSLYPKQLSLFCLLRLISQSADRIGHITNFCTMIELLHELRNSSF